MKLPERDRRPRSRRQTRMHPNELGQIRRVRQPGKCVLDGIHVNLASGRDRGRGHFVQGKNINSEKPQKITYIFFSENGATEERLKKNAPNNLDSLERVWTLLINTNT